MFELTLAVTEPFITIKAELLYTFKSIMPFRGKVFLKHLRDTFTKELLQVEDLVDRADVITFRFHERVDIERHPCIRSSCYSDFN